MILFFLCLFVITSFPLFAQGSTSKKPIETYKDGKLIKKEWFDVTLKNGDKYKRRIVTYKDGQEIKEESFDYTYANGDKLKKKHRHL